ncbi:MAG: hypothetical protein KGJ06_03670 [Pseudomonadota bacterium]|nr:hypothetical protein [Pseudomonadota bacterium]
MRKRIFLTLGQIARMLGLASRNAAKNLLRRLNIIERCRGKLGAFRNVLIANGLIATA